MGSTSALRVILCSVCLLLSAGGISRAATQGSRSDLPALLALAPTTDPVLLAAGDIASCLSQGDEATAALLDAHEGTVVVLGDTAYTAGTPEEFAACYEPSWGRHRARTRPTPGNHDYGTPGAAGYFAYFGAAAGDPDKGYYSYDLGAWHVVSLNSNCKVTADCLRDSEQVRWLRADLAAHPTACTVAYWHHARFSSGGEHGNEERMRPIWRVLQAAGVDVVLSAHNHLYERFGPQDADGEADPERGITAFVVGTGGFDLHPWGTIQPNSEARSNEIFGVLKLTLHPTGYDWVFLPVSGGTFTDAGSADCH